jgi:hypothetical protein
MDEPMTDRPIIFSAPTVRALIDGTKTQTRRIIKPQPVLKRYEWVWSAKGACLVWQEDQPCPFFSAGMPGDIYLPYQIGDKLWVRENWASHPCSKDHVSPKGASHPWGSPIFKASFNASLNPECEGFSKWRPSIYMPRWASRITLIVDRVRVERLQDISPEDVEDEGVQIPMHHRGDLHSKHRWKHDHFRPLWNSVNADRASWESNPFVVALTFRVIKSNIDAIEEKL